jgi:hypothetical protein
MRYIPEDNLSYPVLIEIGTGSGSGFYFYSGNKLFLVTALHVLYKVDDLNKPLRGNLLKLTSYDRNPLIQTPIELHVDLTAAIIRKDNSKDIVLVEIANIRTAGDRSALELLTGVRRLGTNETSIVGVPTDHLKRFADVLISNESFILGYPNSLSSTQQPQIEPKKPLLRKGIVAGLNNSNQTIILDCPVYFGNSGGLAMEVEQIDLTQKRFWIIGVVSQFIPFIEEMQSRQMGYINRNFENSGYSVVVPIDTILELAKGNPTNQAPTLMPQV